MELFVSPFHLSDILKPLLKVLLEKKCTRHRRQSFLYTTEEEDVAQGCLHVYLYYMSFLGIHVYIYRHLLAQLESCLLPVDFFSLEGENVFSFHFSAHTITQSISSL